MVVPWQAAAVFMGFTGLPHPDCLHSTAAWLIGLGQNTQIPNFNSTNVHLTPNETAQVQQFEEWLQMEWLQILMLIERIILYIVLAIVLWIVFNIFCMFMYKHKVHDQKMMHHQIKPGDQTMKDGNFHHGILGCCANWNECLCACCCPAIRFADTHSAVTDTGFWMSFWLFICANIIAQSAIAGIVAAALPPTDVDAVSRNNQIVSLLGNIGRGLMWGVWSRGKLRTKLGDPNPSSQGRSCDFASWFCCPCLALTQESVEADIAANVVISCPWNLKVGRPEVRGREVAPSDYQRMVGDAVLLDGR